MKPTPRRRLFLPQKSGGACPQNRRRATKADRKGTDEEGEARGRPAAVFTAARRRTRRRSMAAGRPAAHAELDHRCRIRESTAYELVEHGDGRDVREEIVAKPKVHSIVVLHLVDALARRGARDGSVPRMGYRRFGHRPPI